MRRRFVVLLALLGLLALPAAASALSVKSLRTAWNKRERQMGSRSGAYAVDLTTGKVLYKRNQTLRLAPASNEKLFTSAATLTTLGADRTLETTVVTDGELDDQGVLHGDLYLVGSGDPSLNDGSLKELVAQLRDAGLRRVTGAIVGDGGAFDSRRGSYDSGWAYDYDLGGALGGLTWGHGRTDSLGPSHVAAARLRFWLDKRGVKVTKRVKVAAAPGEAETLATHESLTLAELISVMNHPSDNFYAETFIKVLGAERGSAGSTNAGLRVARMALAKLGVRPRMVDGSGLSRVDRTSPYQVVTLLGAMADRPEGAAFAASLAAPGEWGTLAERMTRTRARGRCRAKTGTLNGVSALSGYCTAASGHRIAFSLLENGVCALCAKRLEDQMVPLLTRYTP